MGSPAIVKGGWMRSLEKPKGMLIRIQNDTFQGMKDNSEKYSEEPETASEIIDRLRDFWDRNH